MSKGKTRQQASPKRPSVKETQLGQRASLTSGKVRHAVVGLLDGIILKAEVWTDSEWARLPKARRPTNAQRLPGLGWMHIGPFGSFMAFRAFMDALQAQA